MSVYAIFVSNVFFSDKTSAVLASIAVVSVRTLSSSSFVCMSNVFAFSSTSSPSVGNSVLPSSTSVRPFSTNFRFLSVSFLFSSNCGQPHFKYCLFLSFVFRFEINVFYFFSNAFVSFLCSSLFVSVLSFKYCHSFSIFCVSTFSYSNFCESPYTSYLRGMALYARNRCYVWHKHGIVSIKAKIRNNIAEISQIVGTVHTTSLSLAFSLAIFETLCLSTHNVRL